MPFGSIFPSFGSKKHDDTKPQEESDVDISAKLDEVMAATTPTRTVDIPLPPRRPVGSVGQPNRPGGRFDGGRGPVRGREMRRPMRPFMQARPAMQEVQPQGPREPIACEVRKDPILLPRERALYHAILPIIANHADWYLFPNVPIERLLWTPTRRRHGRGGSIVGRIAFLVASGEALVPVLAIMQDAEGDIRIKYLEKDLALDEAIRGAGVPVLRMQSQESYDADDLAARVKSVLAETK